MSTYDKLLSATLSHPPDPNEPLPMSNRKATIFGTIVVFLAISWLAVVFRLWVRLRVVKEIGWDDVFVVAAQSLNTAAAVVVCLSVEAGLGHHMLYLGPGKIENYLLLFWVEHCIYLGNTALIKIALLLQYLRIFKAGVMRWICIGLLVTISLWGLAFSMVGWFACFPIQGTWDRTVPAKCYGFGFGDVPGFIAAFKAHSASNMMFDILIFITPMILFRTPHLRPKNLLAMAGVFTFGAVVVTTSVWRLHGIVSTKGGTYPYADFTWWSPTIIVLSCLEVDLAIICASMPIFWPIIERSFVAIFVSYEVKVVEERVSDCGLMHELEHMKTRDRGGSVKSNGTSTRELTNDEEEIGQSRKCPYTVGFDPLDEEAKTAGLKTEIQSKPREKWQL
ncbi:hypothetical protein EJ02DRAFT_439661 [Clathrospora elynae]|uniref:Rhodopsin domain-containing protein n=1 Tax=Clathrospora elynae TaxID=706981 RepID=A0A6A5S287_9PLEO|nr:hypothetical protein EJ02DRAFT_439661 [Clathrospora elynae]